MEGGISIRFLMQFVPIIGGKGNKKIFKKKIAVYLVNPTDTEQVQLQTSYTTINK
jgi:hypothetical protein